MTKGDKAAILQEIAALWGVEDRARLPQPNFTVAEAAAQWKTNELLARRRLQALEADGMLESRMVRDEGRAKLVFWKITTDGRNPRQDEGGERT